MHNTKESDIKEIVNSVISKLQPNADNQRQQIFYAWEKIVTDGQKKHSRIVKLDNSNLIINIDSSTWLYQFNLLKHNLIQKINEETGLDAVKNIFFRIGNTA